MYQVSYYYGTDSYDLTRYDAGGTRTFKTLDQAKSYHESLLPKLEASWQSHSLPWYHLYIIDLTNKMQPTPMFVEYKSHPEKQKIILNPAARGANERVSVTTAIPQMWQAVNQIGAGNIVADLFE